MDWLPWRFARNFVRSFCPTLIVLLSWDVWRNLNYAAAARQWAVTMDFIALGAVLAVRLQPPLAPALDQLQYFFPLSFDGLYRLLILLAPLALDIITKSSLWDPWLLVVAYALSVDVSRVRKVPVDDVDPRINLTYLAFSVACVFFVWALVLIRIAPGRMQWRDILRDSAGVFMMVALLALLIWWGQKRKWTQTSKRDPVVEDMEFKPNAVLGVAGVIGAILLGTVLLPKLTQQGTVGWRDILRAVAALLTVVSFVAFAFWWAREPKPDSAVQEVGLKQQPFVFRTGVPGPFKPDKKSNPSLDPDAKN